MKIKQMMMYAGLALAMCLFVGTGCTTVPPPGGSEAAWKAVEQGAPIRVAVYTDKGARSTGMFRWLQHMELSPDVKLTPVDGESIRNGALDDVDVLVMPGGRATLEARAMQTNGLERLRAFIHRGGSYVGTCAGCFMVMQYARGEHLCPLIPYTFWRQGDKPNGPHGPYLSTGYKDIVFNEKAAAVGLAGTHQIKYAGGPVLWPTGETIPDAHMETLATYSPDTPTKAPEGKSIGQCAACVAGTYGKGRLFVLAVHPEADPKNTDVVQAAFKYVTGRKVSFPEPQKCEKATRVGFFCSASLGPKLARWAMDLVDSPDYQVVPVIGDSLTESGLKAAKLSAIVVGDAIDVAVMKTWFNGKNTPKRLKTYMDNGGKIVVWGAAKECDAFKTPHPNLIVVKDGAEARAALDGIKSAK